MTFFPRPPSPKKPRAEQVAEELLARLDAEIVRRSEQHASDFKAFWADPVCTPDEILEAMGPSAPLMLAAASENLRGFAEFAALFGKTLNEVIAPSDYMPRRLFLVNEETGEVTLTPPPDGFDAWGRPIESVTGE
jgi:hypothetical protein